MAKNGSFMSDAVKLTASKIIANGLMMVSAMLLARIRTLEENGTYSQLMLIINLAASIFMTAKSLEGSLPTTFALYSLPL